MKPFLTSKTVVFNSAMAAVVALPSVNAWINEHAVFSVFALTAINVFLRSQTNEAISFKLWGKDF
jgi:hypothetical protein